MTDVLHAGWAGVRTDHFRETLSRVPAAVTVVATLKDSTPHATTVSAFCSLSIDPPLVLVALARSSDLLAILMQTRVFSINLLTTGQEDIGLLCARKGPDKLRGVDWYEQLGVPRLEGAAVWLACEVDEFVPGGDHVIVTGLVTECENGEDRPLLYHRRNFHSLGIAGSR